MKTILLTGKNGQVGWELQRTLAPLGKVVALDADMLNLADPAAVREAVRTIRPQIIVNPAAYTAVDKAESEPALAQSVNGDAPGVLAEEARALGAWMVHYSNPKSVYGRTKLAGEEAVRAAGGRHLILRTSWVYGSRGHNFMLTMLRLARERKELKVVDDQIGAPTWCRSLAEMTAQILAQLHRPGVDAGEVSGLYHMTSSGSVSWHGFAAEILAASGIAPLPTLLPIPSSGYPTPAQRPRNSVLSNEKLARVFGLAAGDWKDNLRLCMEMLQRS
jgi:dTDP-4-dehydrorhamnose reductase